MLIRISLIVAILGGLAVAGIDFFVLKDNITKTIADRDTFNANWHTEADAHRKFEKLAKDTQSKLDKTTQQLVATKQERDDAVAKEADAEKALASSQDNLKKTQEELDATKDKLAAWDALGIPITQARDILNSLKRVQDEEAALQTEKDIITPGPSSFSQRSTIFSAPVRWTRKCPMVCGARCSRWIRGMISWCWTSAKKRVWS
jgi:uncharacterized protein (DUF3084 family)